VRENWFTGMGCSSATYFEFTYIYVLYFVQGMDFNWCVQPDIGLPKPDVVIYLTRDVSAAAGSDSYGDERYENLKFQSNVAEMYDRLKSSEWRVSF